MELDQAGRVHKHEAADRGIPRGGKQRHATGEGVAEDDRSFQLERVKDLAEPRTVCVAVIWVSGAESPGCPGRSTPMTRCRCPMSMSRSTHVAVAKLVPGRTTTSWPSPRIVTSVRPREVSISARLWERETRLRHHSRIAARPDSERYIDRPLTQSDSNW